MAQKRTQKPRSRSPDTRRASEDMADVVKTGMVGMMGIGMMGAMGSMLKK
jgi:hypothetical protein